MRLFAKQNMRGLAVAAVCSFVCVSAFAASGHVSAMIAKARAEIGGAVKVPVYLPTQFPPVINAKIKTVVGVRTNHGYKVTFWYALGAGDAGYAGMVSGNVRTFPSLPNTKVVHLANGTSALFRPVSCGGSCAPANLWWQVSGNEYSVQLKLSPRTAPKTQLSQLLVVANSMARQ